MFDWQLVLVIIWGLVGISGALRGLLETTKKNNVYGNCRIFHPWGAFVWGDMVVFGTFWFLVSLVVLYLKDWFLFLLTFSIFWAIRSFGETLYWFLQQFSTINREPPKNWWYYRYVKNDSVWFINQIFNQCRTVVALIASIYFAKLWLASL